MMIKYITSFLYLLISLLVSMVPLHAFDGDGIKEALTPKMLQFTRNQKPVIIGIVGFAEFSRNELSGPSSSIQVYGASVGTSRFTPQTNENPIVKKEYSGISLLLGGAKEVVHYWNNSLEGPKNAINFTQINLEHSTGYGYDVWDDIHLLLLSSDQKTWTSISPQSYIDMKISDN